MGSGDATSAAARLPVRVAVRCRLSTPADGEPCIAMPSNTTVTVTSGEEEATFTFDACFAESAAQHVVYTELVASPMAALFDGFNCTILAYGQTGSGKTFSMMGSSDETASPAERARAAGIIPRFGAELFERVGAIPGAKVHVSYCQLHNETFFDLLDPSSKAELRLRRSEAKGVHVQGLSEPRVQSAKELLQLLAKAEGARITAATKMNAHSSRSHALLTLALTLPARSRAGGGKTVTSRAHLVDLAGSERYKDAGDAPARQQEAIAINQSLTTLGLVIKTLAEQQQQPPPPPLPPGAAGGASSATGKDSAAHVPYRNSKLTHLLKESLGGSALCVMLCTISPSISSLHESLSTLHFASRARAVVNVATRNLAHEARSSSVDKKRDATPPKLGAPSTAPKLGADATPTKGGGDAQYGARQKHRPPRASFGGGSGGAAAGRFNGSATAPLGRALSAELSRDAIAEPHSAYGAARAWADEQVPGSAPAFASLGAWDGASLAREARELGMQLKGTSPPPPIELPRSPPLYGNGRSSGHLPQSPELPRSPPLYGNGRSSGHLPQSPEFWPSLPPPPAVDPRTGLPRPPASAHVSSVSRAAFSSALGGGAGGGASGGGGVGGGVGSATCSGGFGLGVSSGSGGSPNGNAQLLLDDGGAFDWGGVLGDLGEGAGSLEGQVMALDGTGWHSIAIDCARNPPDCSLIAP
jgi:hypothetical protein